MKKFFIVFILSSINLMVITAEGQQEEKNTKIIFADVSWDSVQIHNRIMGFIIENGLEGYEADYMSGDPVIIVNGIVHGDIDVDMESWHSNFREVYDDAIASGEMLDLGPNYPDGPQGWYVPRFLIEGPDAPAPDLKSIDDLPQYAHLFKDPQDPSKGIVYVGVAGWMLTTISEEKFVNHELGETFNKEIAGSGAALAASMAGNYKKNKAWCGYYWEPSAAFGKFDMVRLKGSEFEPANVNILINKSMEEKAPDVVEILKKYSTTVANNNEFLGLMDKNKWDSQQTAEWFLKNKESVWTAWVDLETAEKIKAALNQKM